MPRYVYLPFTKSVDSNLREVLNAFVDLVNRNIFGHSLFWARDQDGAPFREDSFGRRHFSDNWSSCTNKYQKSDKIWRLEYNFFSRCAKQGEKPKSSLDISKPEPMSISRRQKLSLSDVFYFQKLHFCSYPTDLVKTKTTTAVIVGA